MANNWAQFGSALSGILGGLATSNPNLIPQIVAATQNATNPHASEEDAALAQAEALFAVNPAQAILAIQRAIGLIPPSYLGVTFGLTMVKVDTPPLAAVQAIELARAALKKAPGA
jgi:hypothetical protein